MFITAVIPTKNRTNDLLKAVISIVEQDRVPNELIVVDQSSTNEGQALVISILEKAQFAIKVNYIYDTNITGLVDAKRVAVAESQGDLVCFLEDDVVLEKNYIKEIEAAFFADSKMMGCCGVMTNLPPLSSNYVMLFHLFHRGIFHDTRVGVHGFTEDLGISLIQSRYLSGGISAYRREVFNKIPYDLKNNFFMLEDIDFSTRAADFFGDENFYINPKAKLAHYMSPINRAVFEQKYARKIREFIVFYKKHNSAPYAMLSLAWLLVGLLLQALLQSIKDKKLSPLIGYFKGLAAGISWDINKGMQCP